MAQLVPCETCGNEVAKSTWTCPHCGDRGPKIKSALGCVAIGCLAPVIFILTIVIIASFRGGDEPVVSILEFAEGFRKKHEADSGPSPPGRRDEWVLWSHVKFAGTPPETGDAWRPMESRFNKKNLGEKGREPGYSGILKSYAGSERRGYSIMTQLGGKDVIWRFHCLSGDTEKRRGSR
ncbi:MAG: hypothetical protein CMH76_03635 [Nitrospinae bacterium]|nr:hypothetical protein [Nitrospinota bacterium]